MRIGVDLGHCAGAGVCASTAPAVFDQDDEDGRVILLAAEPEEAERERAVEAIGLCPTGAIHRLGSGRSDAAARAGGPDR